jgi:putative transposase
LVCVTRHGRKVFDAGALAWLQLHFAKVCATMGAELLACDGEADHVHLLIEYPPKHSVSMLVNALKGTSSRLLRAERPDLAGRYWQGVLWSPSYLAVSAGGPPLVAIKRYVEQQRESSASQMSPSGLPSTPPP